MIKGYVKMYEKKIPVTWERETDKYVFDVRQMELKDGTWSSRVRIFDNKVSKKEIEIIKEVG